MQMRGGGGVSWDGGQSLRGCTLGLRTGVRGAWGGRGPSEAHSLQTSEPTEQRFSISRLSENNYDPQEKPNDVLLLQAGARGQQGPGTPVHSFSSTYCTGAPAGVGHGLVGREPVTTF